MRSSLDNAELLAFVLFLDITTNSKLAKSVFEFLKTSLAILFRRFLSTARRETFLEIAKPSLGKDKLFGFAITVQYSPFLFWPELKTSLYSEAFNILAWRVSLLSIGLGS